MENLKTVWNFVVEYYPNYYSSDEIAENDDYTKILDGELNGEAKNIFDKITQERKEYFGATLNESELKEDVMALVTGLYESSTCEIYRIAIEGYLETLKPANDEN